MGNFRIPGLASSKKTMISLVLWLREKFPGLVEFLWGESVKMSWGNNHGEQKTDPCYPYAWICCFGALFIVYQPLKTHRLGELFSKHRFESQIQVMECCRSSCHHFWGGWSGLGSVHLFKRCWVFTCVFFKSQVSTYSCHWPKTVNNSVGVELHSGADNISFCLASLGQQAKQNSFHQTGDIRTSSRINPMRLFFSVNLQDSAKNSSFQRRDLCDLLGGHLWCRKSALLPTCVTRLCSW